MNKNEKEKQEEQDKPEDNESFGLDMDFKEALERFLTVPLDKVKTKESNANDKKNKDKI